ncbi:MAG TPA: hypothetical protein VFT84_16360, partial [Gemmatimonadales bacterium]|nr:hypothetical protein [Gemmatimonadales bacterium]
MTAGPTMPVERIASEQVTTILAQVHDQWVERIGELLAPATLQTSSFWDRWGAVRFLADQFEDRFRLECELAECLSGRLSPTCRARLAATRTGLDRTREALMEAGRRQGSAPQVVLLARRLLDQVRRWCVTLELAATGVDREDLSPRAREVLGRLRTAA